MFYFGKIKITWFNYFTESGKYWVVRYSADTEYRMVNWYIRNKL